MKPVVLVVLFAVPALAAAQMHKCVDERGVTHYTERPIPGCKSRPVDLRTVPPASGANPAPADARADLARKDAELRQRMIAREQADAAAKRQAASRCATARRDLARLESGRRLALVNPSTGERRFVDDAERVRGAEQAREALRGC